MDDYKNILEQLNADMYLSWSWYFVLATVGLDVGALKLVIFSKRKEGFPATTQDAQSAVAMQQPSYIVQGYNPNAVVQLSAPQPVHAAK